MPIRELSSVPEGFIGKTQWAEKAGVSKTIITTIWKDFNPDLVCWVKKGNMSPAIYINWEGTGPNYLLNRPVEKWPEWFRKSRGVEIEQSVLESLPGDLTPEDDGVTNKATEEVKKLVMANEMSRLVLQKAKNEVVVIDAAVDVLIDIAGKMSQTFLSMIPRLAPKLAAMRDDHAVSQLLTKEFNKGLELLAEINEYVESIKPPDMEPDATSNADPEEQKKA
jgi:hypothetical protein